MAMSDLAVCDLDGEDKDKFFLNAKMSQKD